MKRIIYFIKKVFTHNYCDTCEFTKDNVYVVEHYIEAGFLQCEKCIQENYNSERIESIKSE